MHYNVKAKHKIAKPCGAEYTKKDFILNLKVLGLYTQSIENILTCCVLQNISAFDIESLTIPTNKMPSKLKPHDLVSSDSLLYSDTQKIMAVQLPFIIGYMHTLDTVQIMKLLLESFGAVFMSRLKVYLGHKMSFEHALQDLRALTPRSKIKHFVNALSSNHETFKKSLDPALVQHVHLNKNDTPTGCTEPSSEDISLMVEKVGYPKF